MRVGRDRDRRTRLPIFLDATVTFSVDAIQPTPLSTAVLLRPDLNPTCRVQVLEMMDGMRVGHGLQP